MSAFPRAGYGGHLSYNTKQAVMWEDGYTTINHQSFALVKDAVSTYQHKR
jgi:hypothetical protein